MRLLHAVALAVFIAGLAQLQPARADDAGTMRESALELVLNAQAHGAMVVVLQDESGILWLKEEDFASLRLLVPDSPPTLRGTARYFRLDAIAGSRVSVDEAMQRALVSVPSSAFATTRVAAEERARPDLVAAAPGAFVNYQLFAQHANGMSGGSFAELGLFGKPGVLTSTTLARYNEAERGVLRLDTVYTRDLPERLLTLNVGDTITDAGSYGSSVRFGGIRLSRNFSLRPDLLTMPLLSTAGAATVPSTVDVFVNNQLVSSQSLPPGPFTIDRVPAVSGSGDITVVVRDALGREQVTTRSFYSSTSLLARGLSEYALDAGFLRADYAVASNHYGPALAQGTYRRGITNSVTLEGHAEYQDGNAHNAGMNVAFGVGRLGVLNFTAATGGDAGASGVLRGAGFERRGHRLSFVTSGLWATRGYRQIADSTTSSGSLRARAFVQGGVSFGHAGSFALAFARQVYDLQGAQKTLSAGYSLRIGATGMLQVSATRIRGSSHSNAGFLIFTTPLGADRAASISGSTESGSTPEAIGMVMKDGGIGPGQAYRFAASSRGNYDARWQHRSDAAEISLEATRYAQTNAQSAYVTGAATLLDGELNALRTFTESFAIVDAGGIGGVPVYLENQLVATTNANGRALLSELRPFEPNRVSVHPQDLPLETSIGTHEVTVAPPYRSGVVVRLPVQRVRAGTFRLIRSDGAPVPAGAWVDFNGQRFPVVLDGFVYVTTFDHGLSATASWEGGQCRFRIAPPPPDDPLPDMGTISCREPTSPPFQPRGQISAEVDAR